jgi:2-methylaconitate cis-trans-isomerase PrpF
MTTHFPAVLALGCALAMAGITTSRAEVTRPPAGTDIDETRVVSARPQLPAPCVAVRYDAVTVVLARQDLDAQAAQRPEALETDADRIARVESIRAAALLSTLVPPKTAGDCAEVAASALGADAGRVVLDWLENGRALVRDERKGAVVPTVRIRYVGQRCGPLCGHGEIRVSLPDGAQPFLVASWWVS